MVLTSDGLEQATRLAVAAQHAQRFRAAGIHTVHDLGCGIGADAMAMAGLDLRVRAIDADEVTAAIAAVNLRHWPDSTAGPRHGRGVHGTGRRWDARGVGAWLDPARRTPGRGRRRRTHPSPLQRSPRSRRRGTPCRRWPRALPATGAKLSPGLPHAAVPAGAEAQWTSWDGEVVECAVWWGPLVRHGRPHGRRAAGTAPPAVVVTAGATEPAPA